MLVQQWMFLHEGRRLVFQNVQAAYEVLPRLIQIMGDELKWNKARRQVRGDPNSIGPEITDSVVFGSVADRFLHLYVQLYVDGVWT